MLRHLCLLAAAAAAPTTQNATRQLDAYAPAPTDLSRACASWFLACAMGVSPDLSTSAAHAAGVQSYRLSRVPVASGRAATGVSGCFAGKNV